MKLPLKTLCVMALMAAASMQVAQAKRAPARPGVTQGDLCERGVATDQKPADGGEVLTESRWMIQYSAAGEAARRYVFRLLLGGRMLNAHPNDTTRDNDRWKSSGRKVELSFNDGYAIYTGVLNSRFDQIRGQAKNKVGESWSWSAKRLKPCQ